MQPTRGQHSEQALEPEGERLTRNLAELGNAHLEAPESWDLHLTQAEHARAKQVLSPTASHPILAVSVGTKVQSKDWGRDNWRSLLLRIAERHPHYALAPCGAADEAPSPHFAAAGWLSASFHPGPALNLCGQLTPRESAAVFARSRLFLGH